jgi:hypothetical protein
MMELNWSRPKLFLVRCSYNLELRDEQNFGIGSGGACFFVFGLGAGLGAE